MDKPSNCKTLKDRRDCHLIELGVTEIKNQIINMQLTASMAGVKL